METLELNELGKIGERIARALRRGERIVVTESGHELASFANRPVGADAAAPAAEALTDDDLNDFVVGEIRAMRRERSPAQRTR